MQRRDFLSLLASTSALAPAAGLATDGPVTLPTDRFAGLEGREVLTTCNMCNLGCGIIAKQLAPDSVSIRGNPHSPVNRGKLCAKGNAGVFKANHPERLTFPLVRAGKRGEGKWRRTTMEEALDFVASSLASMRNAHGPEALTFWMNVNMDRPGIFERFTYAYGSPHFVVHQSACDSSLHIGAGMLFGHVRTLADFGHAETLFLLGHNPLGARDLVLATREILAAKERGATLIVADPRYSETAAHASKGCWLPIRPGTDGILLAGIARELLSTGRYDKEFVAKHATGLGLLTRHLAPYDAERVCATTGIDRAAFDRTVVALTKRPALVDVNRGVVAHRDGTYGAQMAMILNTLLGSVDRRGGHLLVPWPPLAEGGGLPRVPRPSGRRVDGSNYGAMPLPVLPRKEAPLSLLGRSQAVPANILQDRPNRMRAMVVYAANPVYSYPNGAEFVRAFDKLDLVVAIDAFMTQTAVHADVVLPASVYWENTDIWFPSYPGIALRQPVLRPKGECRSGQEIVLALAARMKLPGFPFATYEDYLRAELRSAGHSFEELRETGFIDLRYQPGSTLARGLDTPSGKIELASSVMAFSSYAPLPTFENWPSPRTEKGYPFHLITFKLPFFTNSATATMPHLNRIQRDNTLLINAATARELSIYRGSRVKVETSRGEVSLYAEPTEGIRPDTLAISHHFGLTRGEPTNRLYSSDTDPLGGNLTFNDTWARVSKVPS